MMSQINVNINKIYVKKTVQFIYSACKGDIMVVDIKQHKSQFKNSNFTITQSAKFLWHCVMVAINKCINWCFVHLSFIC